MENNRQLCVIVAVFVVCSPEISKNIYHAFGGGSEFFCDNFYSD